MGGLLGANKREEWVTLTSDLETSTDQWLNLALKCLQLIQGRPDCVNVIVTQVFTIVIKMIVKCQLIIFTQISNRH